MYITMIYHEIEAKKRAGNFPAFLAFRPAAVAAAVEVSRETSPAERRSQQCERLRPQDTLPASFRKDGSSLEALHPFPTSFPRAFGPA